MVNYLLKIILNIGFINIKWKHLYSINHPGRLLEGGAYFQHFKIRWVLIRKGALKRGWAFNRGNTVYNSDHYNVFQQYQVVPSPDGYGWKMKDCDLNVQWMFHKPAHEEILQLISCNSHTSWYNTHSCLCKSHIHLQLRNL